MGCTEHEKPEEILMGKAILEKPAKRDDPIYKEGFQIFTPRSARGSTPSTKSSPKTPDKASDPDSKVKAQAPKAPEPR